MQLDKAVNLYRKKRFTQIGAFLLLVLFTSALLIQALHHHEQDIPDSCKSKSEKVQAPAQVKTNKANCKLCEIVKQQTHDYTFSLPNNFVVKAEMHVNRHFRYFQKHPVAYILAAANKGPPSFIA